MEISVKIESGHKLESTYNLLKTQVRRSDKIFNTEHLKGLSVFNYIVTKKYIGNILV